MFGGGVSDFILGLGIDSANFGSGLSEATSDVDKFGQHAEEAGRSGGGLGGAFDVIGKGALVAGAGVLAFGGFLVGAAHAANEEQVGMDRLYTSLGNNAKGWDGNTDAVEKYVSQAEKSAFADDKIRDSLGSLVARTHDLGEAQRLQSEAMDLARGKNIDLATASDIIGKVYDGNTGILARYGVAVDKGATSTEALAAIQKTYAGQADKYANSAAGSMDRLQTSMGDALETVGHSVLNLVAGPLASIADWFSSAEVQNGIQTVADFIGNGLTNAFTFVGNAIQAAMPYIQPFINAISSFVTTIQSGGDIGAAAGKMFGGIGSAIQNVWPIVQNALGTLLGNIVGWIGANGPTILATLGSWGLALGKWVLDALPGVLSALGTLIGNIWNWIVANGPTILAQLQVWGKALWQWIVDVTPIVTAKLGELAQALWNWITDTKDGLPPRLKPLVDAVWKWVTDTKDGLPARLAEWATALWTWITDTKDGLPAKLKPLVDGFLKWLTDTKDGMPVLLGNIAGAVWTFLTDFKDGLPAKLLPVINAFLKWLVDTKDGMPKLLGDIAGAVWTFLTDTTNGLPSHLMPLTNAFLHWLVDAKDGLPKMLSDFAGKIWEWITGMGGEVLKRTEVIGGNLVAGVKQGIANAWQGFLNWLSGLMGDIPDIIKKFFGIQSPSKLMADMFENLPKGGAIGFTAAMPTLLNAVNTGMGQMADVTQGHMNNIRGILGSAGSGGSYSTGGGGAASGLGGGSLSGRIPSMSLGNGSVGGSGGGPHSITIPIAIHLPDGLVHMETISIDLSEHTRITRARS